MRRLACFSSPAAVRSISFRSFIFSLSRSVTFIPVRRMLELLTFLWIFRVSRCTAPPGASPEEKAGCGATSSASTGERKENAHDIPN